MKMLGACSPPFDHAFDQPEQRASSFISQSMLGTMKRKQKRKGYFHEVDYAFVRP